MKKDIIAIILGRKGSKGIPNKNIMKILGKPAYHYPFQAAKKSKYISKIFVSTDHTKISKAAKRMNFTLIKRPKYLANNKALFEDALLHAYNNVEKFHKISPKYVVVLMCNAVTINAELIDKGIKMLDKNKKADSAVSVSIFNMYSPLRARKYDKKGFLIPFVPFKFIGDPKKLNCDRESQGNAYFADMSHSICRPSCFKNFDDNLLPQKWMGKKILPVLNENGCDIDEPWQIDMSIKWLKKNGY